MLALSKADRGDLLVLGLLQHRSRHGYELKQLLSGPLSLLGGNLVSTLYYTLRRLALRGYIASDQRAGPNGRFPPRTQWRLTKQGEALLPELCEEALSDLSCPCVLPIAILTCYDASPEAIRGALQIRRNLLAALVLNLVALAADEEIQPDSSMRALTALTAAHCETEARWIDAQLNGTTLPAAIPIGVEWQLFVR